MRDAKDKVDEWQESARRGTEDKEISKCLHTQKPRFDYLHVQYCTILIYSESSHNDRNKQKAAYFSCGYCINGRGYGKIRMVEGKNEK